MTPAEAQKVYMAELVHNIVQGPAPAKDSPAYKTSRFSDFRSIWQPRSQELRFGQCFWQGALSPARVDPPWRGRANFRVLSLGPPRQGQQPLLFVLGGQLVETSEFRNDIWRSKDGGNKWAQVSPHEEGQRGEAGSGYVMRTKWCGRVLFSAVAGWSAEHHHLVNIMYVVGGRSPSAQLADVWASDDLGKSWTRMCAEAPFGPRIGAGLALGTTNMKELFLAGGYNNDDNGTFFDCWHSLDMGESWTRIPTPPELIPRWFPVLASVAENRVLLLGGQRGGQTPLFDAYLLNVSQKRKQYEYEWLPLTAYRDGPGGPTSGLLEDLAVQERPWLLSQNVAVDLVERQLVAVQIDNHIALVKFSSGLTAANEHLRQHDLRLEVEAISGKMPKEITKLPPQGHRKSFGTWQHPFHVLLPADGMRLFFITGNMVWATGGSKQPHPEVMYQLRQLERIGLQLAEKYGLLNDVWCRVLIAVLGRCV
mmetsp:Transcript_110931/g.192343  ORF Transcript_110931/g.192343 Transcript_110931/m.192343 type:complete len:479 (+) Transcript_110931:136-1572(+)